MFKTLIILYARSFWVTECTPNPGRSFPHWRAPMAQGAARAGTQNGDEHVMYCNIP